ncbi:MAG: hypothetical protein JWL74_1916 [Alphaproteobacteria bacterium]|jgi:hypothetical protein|nr:hypothetical protein [Alphaproteobacteria bacterium]
MSRPLGERLARVVTGTVGTFGGEIRTQSIEQTGWASVTFTGARHRLRLTLEGEGAVGAAADFLAALPELDLPIPGHIVADIALVAEERGDDGRYAALELEALTIEDR